jgi:hypothetical protein
MMTQQQKQFILQNREILLQIEEADLEFCKNLIWREKDLAKKSEHSAVADFIFNRIQNIKNIKLGENKPAEQFTGL